MRKQAIEKAIGLTKVSEMLPMLEVIAAQWGLKLSRQLDFAVCKKILINSLLNN